MEEFLIYLLKSLVKHPDDVSIRQEETEDGTLVFYIKVNPEDIGKVIGKGGKVIWSIRTLLRVRAQQEGRRTLVKLEDTEEAPPLKSSPPEQSTPTSPEPNTNNVQTEKDAPPTSPPIKTPDSPSSEPIPPSTNSTSTT